MFIVQSAAQPHGHLNTDYCSKHFYTPKVVEGSRALLHPTSDDAGIRRRAWPIGMSTITITHDGLLSQHAFQL